MGNQEFLEKEISLIEHLSSKLCHDMAGIIGAINNGIEFLEDNNEDLREHATILLRQSSKQLINRIQFFRKLYGQAEENTENNLFELLDLTKEYLSYSKISLIYDENILKKFASNCKASEAKIIMNLIFLSSNSIIGGGKLNIKLAENSEDLIFEITSNYIKLQASLDIILNEKLNTEIDPKNIQAIYASKLLKKYNFDFKLTQNSDKNLLLLLKRQ